MYFLAQSTYIVDQNRNLLSARRYWFLKSYSHDYQAVYIATFCW